MTISAALTSSTLERERIQREAKQAAEPRSYSVVRDDRQSGWYDPGHGVRDDQTGCLVNEEPLSMRRAEELLERLEEDEQ